MEVDDAVSEPSPSKSKKETHKSQPKKVKSSLCHDSGDSTMNASESISQSEMKVAQDLKAEQEANNSKLKYTKERKRRLCRDKQKNYLYDEDLNEELESTSVDEENHLRVKIFKRKRVVQEPDKEYALPAEKKLSTNKVKNKEVGNEDLEVEVKVKEEKYWQSREIERLKKHLITQGLGNKIPTTVMSRKLLLAKLRFEVRTVNHVSVVLAEHTDKFEIKTFTSTEQKHRRMSMEEKSHSSYVCKICGVFQAGVEEKMRMHIEQHLNGKFMCKLCNLDFSSIREKRQHSKQFHPYRGRASNAKVCQCCGQEFWHTTDWKEHAFKCYGEASFTCSFCDEKFPLRKDLLAHLENSHLEHAFTCEKCNRHYFEEKLWANHTVNCDGEIPASSSKTCHLCGKVLSTLITLRSHISGVHNKEKKFQCTLCPYSCLRSKEFKHHMDVHEGNKKHKCEICDYAAVQKCQLVSHMRTHTQEKPYKCDQCSYASAWNVQLKGHKKVHDLENTVTCHQCGVVVKDVQALNRHKKKDHNETAGLSGKESFLEKASFSGRDSLSERDDTLEKLYITVDPVFTKHLINPD